MLSQHIAEVLPGLLPVAGREQVLGLDEVLGVPHLSILRRSGGRRHLKWVI
jgi:hypothetical protein